MSRSVHSKQTHDARSPAPDTVSFNFSSVHPSHKSPTNRQLLDDPSTSILDLDEDVRSSMAFSERNPYDSDDDDTNQSDSEEPPRITSYLGPKMRFHSRAPWEMEEDALDEADETDTGSMNIVSMLTGGRPRKSFSSAGRPSGESSRSQLNAKRSFDTSASHVSHPRGALYALAQESLSTSSLAKPPRQDAFRALGKFSLGRFRSHSPNYPSPTSPNPTAIVNRSEPAPPSPRTSYDSSTTLDVTTSNIRTTERRRSLSYSDGDVHPYANPDHVLSYPTASIPKSPLRTALNLSGMSRNDSNATVTDGLSTVMPKFPATPANSTRRTSNVHGKDISSPVPAPHNSSPTWQSDIYHQEPAPPVPTGANNIIGWTDRSINPGFSLISLEEARALRNRVSNEADTSFTATNPAYDTSINSLSSALSEVNLDNNARTRARSISTSTKAKSAFHSLVAGPKAPERRDSEPVLAPGSAHKKEKDVSTAGKGLKHKKSGFMRLFGKDKDGSTPPPVPALPDSHTLPRTRGLTAHRIPAPSLSPSLLLEAAATLDADSATESSHQGTATSSSSPKRSFPLSLSINTGSSTTKQHSAAYSTDAWTSSSTGSGPGSASNPSQDSMPQSAPAQITEFPALKLRPVSTLFSAHFGDHIVVLEPQEINNGAEGNGPNDGGNNATVPFVQRNKNLGRNVQERQSSFASASITALSTTSYGDHSELSPTASSYVSMSTPGTAYTTPTTAGGFISPLTPGSWGYGARFSEQQQQQSLYTGGYTGASGFSSSTLSVVSRDRERERDQEPMDLVKRLQEELEVSSNVWKQKVWSLEAQVRDLKDEIVELRKNNDSSFGEGCDACGRGGKTVGRKDSCGSWDERPMQSWQQQQQEQKQNQQQQNQVNKTGVINRPRARTGASSRFVNAQM